MQIEIGRWFSTSTVDVEKPYDPFPLTQHLEEIVTSNPRFRLQGIFGFKERLSEDNLILSTELILSELGSLCGGQLPLPVFDSLLKNE